MEGLCDIGARQRVRGEEGPRCVSLTWLLSYAAQGLIGWHNVYMG